MKKPVLFTDHTNLNLKRFINDIRRYQPLTQAEERDLLIAAQAGDKKAVDKLVRHNAAYLITMAKPYQTPYVTDIEDLIEAGALGLIEAIYRINPYRGIRLLTYATPYIRKAIMDYLAHDKLVYVPDNMMRKVCREEAEMYDVLHYDREDTCPDWEREMLDYHLDLSDHEPSIEEIEECLSSLSNRSVEIFRVLHGLADGFEHAPESVASDYHCSRERIRQIDNRVLMHLRQHFDGPDVA